MENNNDTSLEGTNNAAESGENTKTFTQDDVNRIVQERLSKEKNKFTEELQKRTAELDKRERKMNAIEKLRENGLPDYLADALNMETEDTFNESMNAILKMKGESKTEEPKVIGKADLIGRIGGLHPKEDPLRQSFGLE